MTISVSRDLLEKIDLMAKQENRSRSNWIVTQLKNYFDRKYAYPAELAVAEEAPPPARQRRNSKA